MYQSGREGDKAKKAQVSRQKWESWHHCQMAGCKTDFLCSPCSAAAVLLEYMEYYMEKTLKSKRQVLYFECY